MNIYPNNANNIIQNQYSIPPGQFLPEQKSRNGNNPKLSFQQYPSDQLQNARSSGDNQMMNEMRETINVSYITKKQILQLKINKLEQLLILKDERICELSAALNGR